MIRRINKMVCLIWGVLFLYGCSKCTLLEQTPLEQMPDFETEAASEASQKSDYDVYGIDSAKAQFTLSIEENPIDKAYEEEISSVSTSGEMIQIETKYISFWQEEMESTIVKYMDILSDEDKKSFEQSQTAFNEFTTAAFDFESEILLQDKYTVRIGASSKWLLYVERKNTIRERTIHIKYLHFLVEHSLSDGKTHKSLTFDSWRQATDPQP